ncbi:TPA: hypothetical protein ACRNRX_000187 [Pseudomonas aeruginosa]|uniref:hypothetical protein n=1 Tax=Pseudomonas aeruginosa TaxID=287 RepID=UPI001293943A|nr:hypothetical protein [Pseudomonas aeruginosa]
MYAEIDRLTPLTAVIALDWIKEKLWISLGWISALAARPDSPRLLKLLSLFLGASDCRSASLGSGLPVLLPLLLCGSLLFCFSGLVDADERLAELLRNPILRHARHSLDMSSR